MSITMQVAAASTNGAGVTTLTPEISPQSATVCQEWQQKQICHYVSGSDLTVTSALLKLQTTSTSVCNTTGEWTYVRPTGGTITSTTSNPTCVRFTGTAELKNIGVLRRGSQLCGRIKSSATGNAYSPWMCARIG